jgi:hypothetical protein
LRSIRRGVAARARGRGIAARNRSAGVVLLPAAVLSAKKAGGGRHRGDQDDRMQGKTLPCTTWCGFERAETFRKTSGESFLVHPERRITPVLGSLPDQSIQPPSFGRVDCRRVATEATTSVGAG